MVRDPQGLIKAAGAKRLKERRQLCLKGTSFNPRVEASRSRGSVAPERNIDSNRTVIHRTSRLADQAVDA
jgi:hypothetical protein